MPSNNPIQSEPSSIPSQRPSTTSIPSSSPTQSEPSTIPTQSEPSSIPKERPSVSIPSSFPNIKPSEGPSLSKKPTKAIHNNIPTIYPFIVNIPSRSPSHKPSVSPFELTCRDVSLTFDICDTPKPGAGGSDSPMFYLCGEP
eukprot:UN33638